MGMLLLCFLLGVQSDEPAKIEKFQINVTHISGNRRLYREPTKLSADIKNLDSSRQIKEVEFQFDVIDAMRKVIKERLFVKISDIGSRTIEPGKSRRWIAELGDTRFPAGCDAYGTLYSGTDCISEAKINIVHFKDGSKWERPGWKDEPNPNKKQ